MNKISKVIDELFYFKYVKEVRIRDSNKGLIVELVTEKDNYEDIRSVVDEARDEALFIITKCISYGK